MKAAYKLSKSITEAEVSQIYSDGNNPTISFEDWLRNNPKAVKALIIAAQILIVLLKVTFIAQALKLVLQVAIMRLETLLPNERV